MFFQKASDLVEEATVAEVTVVVEVIQDQPEAALHRQGLTVVHRYAQALEPLGQALAEATAVAVLLAHRERVQHGQAAQYGKNRVQ